jgi:hypothetical protein
MLEPINKNLKKTSIDETKLQPLYLKFIKTKNTNKLKARKNFSLKEGRDYSRLYNIFYKNKKKLDNLKNKGINYFSSKEEKKNNFLNLLDRSKKFIHLFSKEKNLPLVKKVRINNMLNERINDINERRVSNRLKSPHYFFPSNYVERSMPSQVSHWTSSTYNFNRKEKSGTNYLDIYTSKLIKLFFTIKYIKIKDMLNSQWLDGFKYIPHISVYHDINKLMFHTSKVFKGDTNITGPVIGKYKPVILTLNWVNNQIARSQSIGNILDLKSLKAFGSYYPKKKWYLVKLARILLSKPLFKHTSFNLVIDLYLFNNKRYKFRILRNLVLRRTMYKYMYSMYSDYYKKIQETVNRPRFFYINLIEPKISYHYKNVITTYWELISWKPVGINMLSLLFKLKTFKRNYLYFIKNKLLHSHLNVPKESEVDQNQLINNNNRYSNSNGNNKRCYNKKVRINRYRNRNINRNININDTRSYIPVKTLRNIYREFYKQNKKVLDKNSKNLNVYDKVKEELLAASIAESQLKLKKDKEDMEMEVNKSKPIDKKALSHINKNKLNKNKSDKNLLDKNILDKNILDKNKGDKNKGDKNKWAKDILEKDKLYKNKWEKNKLEKEKLEKNILDINIIKKNLIKQQEELDLKEWLKYKEESLKYLNKPSVNKVGRKSNSITEGLSPSFFYKNKKQYIYSKEKNYNKGFAKLINNDSKEIGKYKIKNGNKYLYLLSNYTQEQKLKTIKKIRESYIKIKLQKDSKENKKKNSKLIKYSNMDFKYTYNKVKNNIKFGKFWSLLYLLSVMEKEFTTVSKDVLIRRSENVLPYKYFGDYKRSFADISENLDYQIGNYEFKLWPLLYPNERENKINFKLGYNENIFKPYYRKIIPLLFIEFYNGFIYYLGSYNTYYSIKKFFNNKDENINTLEYSNMRMYNFVPVKLLFDLLQYNYRSLIRLKPKYYFINKFRYYKNKLYRWDISNWRVAVRFVKKLRVTRSNHWPRYLKIASYYYGRLVQNAELDTENKIIIPFVLHFEDILYTIYGKWAIIRLWPLKKYILSSYILARRAIVLIVWRTKRQKKNKHFIVMSSKLISGLRLMQIKKTYDDRLEHTSRWPEKLINIMDEKVHKYRQGYTKLEYNNEKHDRNFMLGSYASYNTNLTTILPPNFSYIAAFNKNIDAIWKGRGRTRWLIRTGSISNIEFVYYWLRPFRQYIRRMQQGLDITGVRLTLSGRAGVVRNNLRSTYKTKFYGSLLGPSHDSSVIPKPISIGLPRLRGHVRSNIDYAFGVSKTTNGAISLKVWIASLFAVDAQELLLHLVRIKDLYSQLIQRHYIVDTRLANINKRYIYKELSDNVEQIVRKKRNRKRKMKRRMRKIIIKKN